MADVEQSPIFKTKSLHSLVQHDPSKEKINGIEDIRDVFRTQDAKLNPAKINQKTWSHADVFVHKSGKLTHLPVAGNIKSCSLRRLVVANSEKGIDVSSESECENIAESDDESLYSANSPQPEKDASHERFNSWSSFLW